MRDKMRGTCDQACGVPASANVSAVAGEGIAKKATALKSAGKMMDARKRWNGFEFGVILRKG